MVVGIDDVVDDRGVDVVELEGTRVEVGAIVVVDVVVADVDRVVVGAVVVVTSFLVVGTTVARGVVAGGVVGLVRASIDAGTGRTRM